MSISNDSRKQGPLNLRPSQSLKCQNGATSQPWSWQPFKWQIPSESAVLLKQWAVSMFCVCSARGGAPKMTIFQHEWRTTNDSVYTWKVFFFFLFDSVALSDSLPVKRLIRMLSVCSCKCIYDVLNIPGAQFKLMLLLFMPAELIYNASSRDRASSSG